MTEHLRHLFARLPLRLGAIVAAVAALALSTAACGDVLGGNNDIEILWPRSNARLWDEEVLRARVRGRQLNDYDIYWSIDGGVERLMWNEWEDRTPHKAYVVDTWYWDWNGRGPYTLRFVAEDYRGREIARRTVRVYVE